MRKNWTWDIEMNVDEAMKVAKREVLGWFDDMHTAGPVLSAEVERLRAELATANTKTHAEKQNRTVEVDGAVRLLKESREEVERLRGELAAAKAASFDVEEDEQDHEAIEIFGMSHFYGSLWITKKGEEYFWFLDDYNGGEWKPITKRLHNTRDQRARKGKHEFRK